MSKISARRDMAIIAAVTLAAAVICVKFNLSEALLAWTRPRERLQLDEVPAVLLVVAVSLVWFSSDDTSRPIAAALAEGRRGAVGRGARAKSAVGAAVRGHAGGRTQGARARSAR